MIQTENLAIVAPIDHTANQYLAVNYDGNLAAASTSVHTVVGFLMNDPVSGGTMDVQTKRGTFCYGILGGTVSAGAALEVAAGKLVTRTTGVVVARAMTSGVEDNAISIQIL